MSADEENSPVTQASLVWDIGKAVIAGIITLFVGGFSTAIYLQHSYVPRESWEATQRELSTHEGHDEKEMILLRVQMLEANQRWIVGTLVIIANKVGAQTPPPPMLMPNGGNGMRPQE